jgi:hypothetical protein
MFQVMVRHHAEATWERYGAAVADPFTAMRLLQRARQDYADVTTVQAAGAGELELLIARLLNDAPAPTEAPEMAATMAATLPVPNPMRLHLPLEYRRWELERGPGGDHDQPYRFVLPADPRVLGRWLRLFALHRKLAAAPSRVA